MREARGGVLRETMCSNQIIWLEEFMLSLVDGEWEHCDGITIKTLDNPGWEISVDLEGTEFANLLFDDVSVRRTDEDWIDCRRDGRLFRGFCGPRNLSEVLQIFCDWVEKHRGSAA